MNNHNDKEKNATRYTMKAQWPRKRILRRRRRMEMILSCLVVGVLLNGVVLTNLILPPNNLNNMHNNHHLVQPNNAHFLPHFSAGNRRELKNHQLVLTRPHHANLVLAHPHYAKLKQQPKRLTEKRRKRMDKTLAQTAQADDHAAKEETERETETEQACVTTFQRNKIPESERGFMLFTAPPAIRGGELPSPMASWNQALQGKGTYVVLTNDPHTRRVCREHDIPTMCTEHSDEGLPLFNKMLDRMERSQPHGIVAFVNSDISVKQYNIDPLLRFLSSLNEIQLELLHTPEQHFDSYISTGNTSEYWMAVAVRTDLAQTGIYKGTPLRHNSGGYDFWAWNIKAGDKTSLLPFEIPPFRYPLACYDNWLLDMVVQVGERNVIDASQVTPMYHQNHKRVGKVQIWNEALENGVTGVFLNRHFTFHEPRFGTGPYKKVRHWKRFGTPSDVPYRVVKSEDGNLTFHQKSFWSYMNERYEDNHKCFHSERESCHQQVVLKTEQTEQEVQTIPFYNLPSNSSQEEAAAAKHWRYTLFEQLEAHTTKDGFILLTSVSYAYREHVLNFKCAIERIGMQNHFVIAAMDKQVYEWGVRRGLAIYLAACAKDTQTCPEYGSNGFQSEIVLEVLDAGYSVIWSDLSITWFFHPFDALSAFLRKDGHMAIQSNAPLAKIFDKDIDKTDNPTNRLNASLFVAPNNDLVRSALREIVLHAASTGLMRQSSFDEILCSRPPSEHNASFCTYKPASTPFNSTGKFLPIELLDLLKVPDDTVLDEGENTSNAYELDPGGFAHASGVGLIAVHHNLVSAADWWFLDGSLGCRYRGDSFDPADTVANS